MIASRLIMQVEAGRLEELIELTASVFELTNWDEKGLGRWRIYTIYIGRANMLAIELEFEDFAQWDEYWSDFRSNPKLSEFMSQLDACTTREGRTEVWNIVREG